FQGEPDLQLEGATSWGGYVAQELDSEVIITAQITNEWNAANRQLTVKVTGGGLESISEEIRLSVMILESGIKDTQLTPSGKDNDYEHKHVLRKMLTNYAGDAVASSLNTGGIISEQYSYTLPA